MVCAERGTQGVMAASAAISNLLEKRYMETPIESRDQRPGEFLARKSVT
jgi:hypothetical protein